MLTQFFVPIWHHWATTWWVKLGNYFQNVISFSDIVPYNCNISAWNWSNTLKIKSARWILMVWCLTHWGRDKMAAIFQVTCLDAFPLMKMYKFRLGFPWSLLTRVQLTICRHWSAQSHYLNQLWRNSLMSLGLNELSNTHTHWHFEMHFAEWKLPHSKFKIPPPPPPPPTHTHTHTQGNTRPQWVNENWWRDNQRGGKSGWRFSGVWPGVVQDLGSPIMNITTKFHFHLVSNLAENVWNLKNEMNEYKKMKRWTDWWMNREGHSCVPPPTHCTYLAGLPYGNNFTL